MHQYYRQLILSIGLFSLLGCQSPTTGEAIFQPHHADTFITTAVLEAMLNNEYTSNLNVHVVTLNHAVVLSGYVKTIRQSDTCEEVARKTPGVQSVQNNIIVRK
jgi:hyperosmotically inducible protein